MGKKKKNKKKQSAQAPQKEKTNKKISKQNNKIIKSGIYEKLKPILFILIIVCSFFLFIEFVLFLFGVKPALLTEDPFVGFSGNIPLFEQTTNKNGDVYLVTAKNKLKFFNDQIFPKDKTKNSYRIFCMGGSTTHGRPYNYKVSFCGWLDAFLKKTKPDINWEVINAGGASYASYRVARLMQELVQYSPDLFIVYSGHNEFLENRSYSKLANMPDWFMNINSVLHKSRTYSGMKRLIESVIKTPEKETNTHGQMKDEVDTILSKSIGPVNYHRDDNLKKQILNHYRFNLEKMVLLAKNAKSKILFITPVENLKDMSPFKSEHKKGLTGNEIEKFNSLIVNGKQLLENELFSEALGNFQQAMSIDNQYADLYFYMGKAYFGQKKYNQAGKYFWQAIDEDIAPLRMISPMKKIIVSIAKDNNIPVLDFENKLKKEYFKRYNHSIFGNEIFIDHVHTNMEGYRILGLHLFKVLKKMGVLSEDVSIEENQINEVIEKVKSSLDENYYIKSFIQLAKVLSWAGKFSEAENVLKNCLANYTPNGKIYFQLGKILSKQEKNDEAINVLNEAIKIGYQKPELYSLLAAIYRKIGNYPMAIANYKKKFQLDEDALDYHFKIGGTYLLQKDYQLTIEHSKKALAIDSKYFPAILNLISALSAEKKYDEALNIADQIIKQNPTDYKMFLIIGIINFQKGNKEQARKYFSQALKIKPDFQDAKRWMQKVQLQK